MKLTGIVVDRGGHRWARVSCQDEPMEERKLSPVGRKFSSSRGNLALFFAGPLLVARFTDHGEADFASPIMATFDAILTANHRVEIFFDMTKMVSYDSALRTRMTI